MLWAYFTSSSLSFSHAYTHKHARARAHKICQYLVHHIRAESAGLYLNGFLISARVAIIPCESSLCVCVLTQMGLCASGWR